MTATAAAFGFRPSWHPTGLERAKFYPIVSGYAANIYKGDPVLLGSGGNLGAVTIGATSGDLVGVFAGVEYVDVTGRPVVSNFWPTGLVATQIRAYVWDDPDTVFEAQTDGTGTVTAAAEATWVGGQMNCVAPGTTVGNTGLSASALAGSSFTSTAQAQFRIIRIATDVRDTVGDQFLTLQVQIAQHQFRANKVAV
jgi:hypothetical protein